MGRKGSSELIEFLIALFVGLLAVLGATLCIGFLLVEPLRNPPGQTEPIIEISKYAEFMLSASLSLSLFFPRTCTIKFSPTITTAPTDEGKFIRLSNPKIEKNYAYLYTLLSGMAVT